MDERTYTQISAYRDDELTPQEAREVERWLVQDPEAEQCYRAMQGLGQHLQRTAIPGTPYNPERLLDRAQWRMTLTWGAGITAAAVVGGVLMIPLPMAVPVATPAFQISQYVLEDHAPLDPYAILLSDNVVVAQR